MQIYPVENCIAARELQTHRADLKNRESGLGCRYVGMQITLLMTMALLFDRRKTQKYCPSL